MLKEHFLPLNLDLKVFAVVRTITYFNSYLYSHSVTVNADHTVVKAALETQYLNDKHARWWT